MPSNTDDTRVKRLQTPTVFFSTSFLHDQWFHKTLFRSPNAGLYWQKDRAFTEFQGATVMTGFPTWHHESASSGSTILLQVRATRAFQRFLFGTCVDALLFICSSTCKEHFCSRGSEILFPISLSALSSYSFQDAFLSVESLYY